MAEREEFEPSVRFWRANPRLVRKLQIAKSYQRISHQNPALDLCNSPVSIRHPFELESEGLAIIGIKCAFVRRFEPPPVSS